MARDYFGGHANNLGNQQRGLNIADHPTQNCPPVRAYASTSKDTKNPEAVVKGTLSVLVTLL